jgi:hypothetical protein
MEVEGFFLQHKQHHFLDCLSMVSKALSSWYHLQAKGAANETLQNIGSALQWAQVQFSGDGQSRGS